MLMLVTKIRCGKILQGFEKCKGLSYQNERNGLQNAFYHAKSIITFEFFLKFNALGSISLYDDGT